MRLTQKQRQTLVEDCYKSLNTDAVIAAYTGISKAGTKVATDAPQFINSKSGNGIPTAAEIKTYLMNRLTNEFADSYDFIVNVPIHIGYGFTLTLTPYGNSGDVTAAIAFTVATGSAKLATA